MAGDEDRLALARVNPDLCRLRMAEGFGVRGVEDLHDAVVQLANGEGLAEQFAPRWARGG